MSATGPTGASPKRSTGPTGLNTTGSTGPVFTRTEDYADLNIVTHPFWHLCRKCWTLTKLAGIFLALDIASELLTFYPIHRLFEGLGWI